MKKINRNLTVVLTGDDVMRFQKAYSYYMSLDDTDSIDRMTRSAYLRLVILLDYNKLLAEGKISPIQSEQ